jgi:hypothetical protein
MCEFFNSKISLVPEAQTLQIAALIEAGAKAIATPDQWVDRPVHDFIVARLARLPVRRYRGEPKNDAGPCDGHNDGNGTAPHDRG